MKYILFFLLLPSIAFSQYRLAINTESQYYFGEKFEPLDTLISYGGFHNFIDSIYELSDSLILDSKVIHTVSDTFDYKLKEVDKNLYKKYYQSNASFTIKIKNIKSGRYNIAFHFINEQKKYEGFERVIDIYTLKGNSGQRNYVVEQMDCYQTGGYNNGYIVFADKPLIIHSDSTLLNISFNNNNYYSRYDNFVSICAIEIIPHDGFFSFLEYKKKEQYLPNYKKNKILEDLGMYSFKIDSLIKILE